jgi:hypothetical protein
MSSDMHACTDRIQWFAEFMSRLLIYSIYINSYYEDRQSILNYIMSQVSDDEVKEIMKKYLHNTPNN